MKTKTFTKLLIIIISLCLLLTILHFVYACIAYPNASIIYFIGKEIW